MQIRRSASQILSAAAQAVLHRANQGVCRELRLWGPRVHPGCFPRSLQTVRLDCWAYEGADVRALVHLPSLRTLTLHFLPVSLVVWEVGEACGLCQTIL